MVKRYVFSGGGMDEAFNPAPDDYLYVRSADYDALAAELAEQMKYFIEGQLLLEAAKARVQALEAALLAWHEACDDEERDWARARSLPLLKPTQSSPAATSETKVDPSTRTGPYTGDYDDLPGDRSQSEPTGDPQ